MKQATILIADDEREIADLIAIHLEKENHRVLKAFDGQEALDTIKNQFVDLVILDIMMPHIDGYEVTRSLRKTYNMPIIFLSAKTSDFDKVQGLVIGADDYMTKPFTPIELVARVNAQLRRYMELNQPTSNHEKLEFGGLMIIPDQRKVCLYDKDINLTPKEFDILYLLARHPQKVFSADNIFKAVWGEDYFEGTNTVMVHIRTLRKKLAEERNNHQWIKTVWGVGYSFNG
ncbi:response regulator transcription factor [Thalassobacillus sp. CUG 92003]|uniref:response regulator transcription factor n=1 Tax=Thalassobacillus sp. CUG 92003 TaxID=2736641 RepID=UPI0015E7B8DE|nr:response regulator transcription factor [Thalassobacillus sp. CUG 92003]